MTKSPEQKVSPCMYAVLVQRCQPNCWHYDGHQPESKLACTRFQYLEIVSKYRSGQIMDSLLSCVLHRLLRAPWQLPVYRLDWRRLL